MTEIINVLLVDDNKELCNLIETNLNGKSGIKVVGTASDGVSAIRMISELEPDIVLLDIIMPNLDGLGVLERTMGAGQGKRPLFIVFTAMGGDMVVQKAMELGADYYMMKPVDMDLLISRIVQIFNDRQVAGGCLAGNSAHSVCIPSSAGRIEQIITDLIKSMGVTPNLAGYSYLREAVMMAVEEPQRLSSVSRNIYSEVAKNHKTNTRNVDRAIRCAIDSAHKKTKNMNNPIQDAYMSLSNKKRPNSAQIISFLAEMAGRKHRT
ncbi:MAG: sporulation transcription factor Spo0A [Clostridiaceae bacterium]|nr:sporulation transcription factor Spo0A [Clostridiaceae bacterium]